MLRHPLDHFYTIISLNRRFIKRFRDEKLLTRRAIYFKNFYVRQLNTLSWRVSNV